MEDFLQRIFKGRAGVEICLGERCLVGGAKYEKRPLCVDEQEVQLLDQQSGVVAAQACLRRKPRGDGPGRAEQRVGVCSRICVM